MLRCSFFIAAGGLCRGFELSGHARGGPKGENLVCAGASTLAQTCLSSLQVLLRRTPLVEKGESGYLKCVLEGTPDAMDDLLFRSMALGLHYLEQSGGNPGIGIEYVKTEHDSGGKIDGS